MMSGGNSGDKNNGQQPKRKSSIVGQMAGQFANKVTEKVTEKVGAEARRAARDSFSDMGSSFLKGLSGLSESMRSFVTWASESIKAMHKKFTEFKAAYENATTEAERAKWVEKAAEAAADEIFNAALKTGEKLTEADKREVRESIRVTGVQGGIEAIEEVTNRTVRESVRQSTKISQEQLNELFGKEATPLVRSSALMSGEVKAPPLPERKSVSLKAPPLPERKSVSSGLTAQKPVAPGLPPRPVSKQLSSSAVVNNGTTRQSVKAPLSPVQEESAAEKWARLTKKPAEEYQGNKLGGISGGEVELAKPPVIKQSSSDAKSAKPVTSMFAEMQAKQQGGLKKVTEVPRPAAATHDPNSMMGILAKKMAEINIRTRAESEESNSSRHSFD